MMRTSLILIAAMAVAPAFAAGDLRLSRLAGTASLNQDGRSQPALENQALKAGDVLTAGRQSRAGVSFDGAGALTLAGLSELQVFEAKSGSAKAPALAKLKLLAGAVRVLSIAPAKRLPQDIRLNVGMLKTRVYDGEIWGASTAEGDTVCLIKGAVEVQANRSDAPEKLSQAGRCLRRDSEGQIALIAANSDAILTAAIAATVFPVEAPAMPRPLVALAPPPPSAAIAALAPKLTPTPPPAAKPTLQPAAKAPQAMVPSALPDSHPLAVPPKPEPALPPKAEVAIATKPLTPPLPTLPKPVVKIIPKAAPLPAPSPVIAAPAKPVSPAPASAQPALAIQPKAPPLPEPDAPAARADGQIRVQTPVQTIVQSEPAPAWRIKTVKPQTLPRREAAKTEPAAATKAPAPLEMAKPVTKPEVMPAAKPAVVATAAASAERAPAKQSPAKSGDGKRWTVVVMSSPNRATIESRTRALQDEGYVANLREAEVKGQRVFRLTVGEFSSKEEAAAYSARTLVKAGFQGWLNPI